MSPSTSCYKIQTNWVKLSFHNALMWKVCFQGALWCHKWFMISDNFHQVWTRLTEWGMIPSTRQSVKEILWHYLHPEAATYWAQHHVVHLLGAIKSEGELLVKLLDWKHFRRFVLGGSFVRWPDVEFCADSFFDFIEGFEREGNL